MLAAAQANLQAGAFDAALGLLAAAEAGPLDELGRARADLLHAEVAFAQNRGSDAPPLLLRAASTLEPLDVRLSRETYLDAWSAALFAGQLASAGGLLEVSRAVEGRPRAAAAPSSLAICCWTASRSSSPRGAPPRRPCCSARPPRSPGPRSRSRRCSAGAGWRRRRPSTCGTTTRVCAVATRAVQLARDAGALEVLAVGVNVLGQAVRARRRLRDGRAADRRGRCGHGGHRHARRPVRRARARRVPRPGGRGLRADRRHHQGAPPPAARGPPSSTPIGPTRSS